MPTFFDLQKFAATGIASPDMSAYDKARALSLFGGGKTQTMTGVPPLSFKANGKPLISWSMKGNGSQSGTPTPDNPVMPTFCGVRTGNLFDPNSTRYQMGKASNNTIGNTPNGAMFYIEADPNTTYKIKIHNADSTFVRLYLSDNPIVEGSAVSYALIAESETTINPEVTISNTSYKYLWIQTGGTWYTEHGGDSIMLNAGTESLPYEPFGYKIPITCAGQTVPVYLGQAQTVRRVRKVVLDGTENLNEGTSNYYIFIDVSGRGEGIPNSTALCTHTESGVVVNNNGTALFFKKSVFVHTSSADFKSYLAAQYAAGTPVVVWYVLREPTTGIVNEPLCKIVDYADELSSEDAGVTIPTSKGQNTLTVEGDLPPSSMTITYK